MATRAPGPDPAYLPKGRGGTERANTRRPRTDRRRDCPAESEKLRTFSGRARPFPARGRGFGARGGDTLAPPPLRTARPLVTHSATGTRGGESGGARPSPQVSARSWLRPAGGARGSDSGLAPLAVSAELGHEPAAARLATLGVL